MKRNKHTMLHERLLNIMAVSLIIAISLSGSILVALGHKTARARSIENLEMMGQIFAADVGLSLELGAGYENEVEQSLRSARFHSDIRRICVFDRQGRFVAQYKEDDTIEHCEPTQEALVRVSARKPGFDLAVILPVLSVDERVGQLYIESNGSQLRNLLSVITMATLAILFGTLLLAFLFGSRQIKSALIPLKKLGNTGTSIINNPFSSQRAIKYANDEVGNLVDIFNTVLDTLAAENTKLQQSENQFRILNENAPVGIFLRSEPKNFHFVNHRWLEITGLNQSNTQRFTDLIASDYKRSYISELAQLKLRRSVVINYEFVRLSGERRFLQEFISTFEQDNTLHYIGSLLDVTELKRTQLELEKLALYDPLTQLPNRRFFTDHLRFTFASAEKKHRKIAVFMMDLDNFKRVNDTLGHEVGDRLLEKVAVQLRESVFLEDVVARLGGDEFMLLVDGLTNLNSIEFIAKRLLKAMSTSTTLGPHSIKITGSIGVAVFPEDATNTEQLLRHADIAMYSSKARGGNCFSCYSSELDAHILEQLAIENNLQVAIQNGAIDVHLQPQVSASDEKTCWAEALVRWYDIDEGMILPARFISIAEDSGLIHELGHYVLEKVCRMFAEQRELLDLAGIAGVSVNLSAKQFYSENLLEGITGLFTRYKIDPRLIEFELTESTVADDLDKATHIMQDIRNLGCRLSLDDFGTGYSSLAYLKRFPITCMKIDQSFVRDIPTDKDDCEIACTIITLAHSLGLTVVAEGVETRAQADFLRKSQCEYFQGYLFSHPLPLEELARRASRRPNSTATEAERAGKH